ncbi:MAG: EF-P lysine aminoacylase GenX [Bdellovibrio sp.]|nr:EF-P lysine aminoacylase GenX [Bdellovibrio sp.]
MNFKKRIQDPRRQKNMRIRTLIETGIREFFLQESFIEVRTPLLVKSPGMEPHIRPFKLLSGAYLPTSPEFAMKKLLAGGLEKIFQICPAFRNEPISPIHHPEFTILEWYRTHASLQDIMKDVENLIYFLSNKILGTSEMTYKKEKLNLTLPWPKFKIIDLFQTHVGINLIRCKTLKQMQQECKRLDVTVSKKDSWDDLYFKIWLDHIEPKLPSGRGVFVYDFPPTQSALSIAEKDQDGNLWAKRFEFYLGGLELGNAFQELTDPVEQKRRFINDMKLRKKTYGSQFPPNPIDEKFISALKEGIPQTAGIAVGVDRLVMLFADEVDIDYTLWLPSM